MFVNINLVYTKTSENKWRTVCLHFFLFKAHSGCCEDCSVSERKNRSFQGLACCCAEGHLFSLLVSICQWGERVEWVWGSFHREGLLWTLWIGKESVILAVHNEKTYAYWSFQNFDSHSLTAMDWYYGTEYSLYHRPSVFPVKQQQGTGLEEFLQAIRPGNLHFPTYHANARCHQLWGRQQ